MMNRSARAIEQLRRAIPVDLERPFANHEYVEHQQHTTILVSHPTSPLASYIANTVIV